MFVDGNMTEGDFLLRLGYETPTRTELNTNQISNTMKRFQQMIIGVLYALLGVVTPRVADAWNNNFGLKTNYWIMRNCNNRYCLFRFWIAPNKPTWERVV